MHTCGASTRFSWKCRFEAGALLLAVAWVAFAAPHSTFAQALKLRGDIVPQISAARSVGEAEPDRQLSKQIRIAPRNQKELTPLLAELQDPSSPRYRQWLSSEDFSRRFGPSTADVEEVGRWLKSQGFRIVSGRFAASGGTCPFQTGVGPGQSCYFEFRFSPAGVGKFAGTFSITTNSTKPPPFLSLHGNGVKEK